MQSNQQLRKEQMVYATLLSFGVKTSLQALTLALVVYVSSIFFSFAKNMNAVPYWHLPLNQYHSAVGLQIHGGWMWVTQLPPLELLSLTTVIYLASITIFCYMKIIPVFLKSKDYVYTILATAEVLVLLLAASGVLNVGGH